MMWWLGLLGGTAWAAESSSAMPALGDLFQGGLASHNMMALVALVSVLSLAPSLLVVLTSFTRLVVVFSFLRNAMGLQQSPPNTVFISLALFLTAFIMEPQFTSAYNQGVRPYLEKKLDEKTAFEKTVDPFARFMQAHVREKDVGLFLDVAKVPAPATIEATPLRVLVPAFMISELRRAFEIGFLLFLPFLVIDLVVASVLMSLGMMMLPPATVSFPLKLVFFVLVDGWHMLVGSLVKGYSA